MSSPTVNPTNNLQQLNQDDVSLDKQKNQNTQDILNAGSSQCLTKNINDEQITQRSPAEIESLIRLYCAKCEKNVEKDNSDKKVKKCLNCKSKLHYRCGICKKNFHNRKKNLYNHLKIKCNLKFYKCSTCAERFQSSLDLKAHVETVHNLIIKKCQKCGKQFKKSKHLSEHQKSCGVEANIKCQDCDFVTNSLQSLEKHKLTIHTYIKLEDYHECSECNNTFKTKQYLANHVSRKHRHIKPEDRHKCSKCSNTYKTKQYLLNHVITKHPDVRSEDYHQCSQCSRTFKMKQNLLKHISKEHTLTSNNSRPEITCDKKFKSNKNLKLHKKSIHNLVKNKKCQYCNFVTKSLKSLKRHILNTHIEPKYYQKCLECEKTFKMKYYLLHHIKMIHS